jgi:hypothetical protein
MSYFIIGGTNVIVGQMSWWDKCHGGTNVMVGQMSYFIIGGTKVAVGQMSYFIIGGTNVGVEQMSGGTNVSGTNVGGTCVCGTKVAPQLKLFRLMKLLSNTMIGNNEQ